MDKKTKNVRRPDYIRLIKYRKFMRRAFDVITISDVEGDGECGGFVKAMYKKEAIFTGMALMELTRLSLVK